MDMNNFGPVILIEVVLVFGGVLLFAWWQLRDLRKEREKDRKKKEQDLGQER
jgi:hypothetical protein